MSKVLVSVIIPAYRAEAFIAETVRSVLAQTHQHLELIVVDDGSPDQTGKVVQTCTSDARLRYIRQENAGVSTARNNGFAQSKGEYIAFLDADDVLLPSNLAEKLAHFASDPDFGLVHADMQVIDAESNRLEKFMRGQEGHLLEELLKWERTCIPTPSSILVKRKVVKQVGGFDPTLSNNADMEFFFRVAAQYKIGRVAKPLALYREHSNQMHNNIAVMERDTLLAYERASSHNLFPSNSFKRYCMANVYYTLGGSWWKNAGNRSRGSHFFVKAFLTDPGRIARRLIHALF